jgi:hypothetical protein
MGNPSFQVDIQPFDKLLSTNTVVDSSGIATVTGASVIQTKPFKINSKTSFSFFVQSSAGSTGVGGAGWRIQANNGYNDSRQVQEPGVWVDVTSDFGAAGASTPPSVHNFAATFSGASASDRFCSWVCPYAFIRFVLVQGSGTGVYSGQFYAGEV